MCSFNLNKSAMFTNAVLVCTYMQCTKCTLRSVMMYSTVHEQCCQQLFTAPAQLGINGFFFKSVQKINFFTVKFTLILYCYFVSLLLKTFYYYLLLLKFYCFNWLGGGWGMGGLGKENTINKQINHWFSCQSFIIHENEFITHK